MISRQCYKPDKARLTLTIVMHTSTHIYYNYFEADLCTLPQVLVGTLEVGAACKAWYDYKFLQRSLIRRFLYIIGEI